MDSAALFAKTPPLKLFFLASIPGAVSMLASALYQTVDGVFVGQFLGATAFAAVNLAMPFVIINFSLADLIGVGSAVPISVRLGKGDGEEANNIFTCACLMIVGTGVLIGAVLYAAAPALIRLMGAEGEFAALAVQYLRVYALSSPFTTIVFALDNYLRICGYIRGSMIVNLIMSASSALLEFLFLGVLGWGIWAAALATCLGMFLCALAAFWPFFRGRALLRFCRPRFEGAVIRQIVSCGSPNFLNNIAGRITSILMNAILVRQGGETAVSVYGVRAGHREVLLCRQRGPFHPLRLCHRPAAGADHPALYGRRRRGDPRPFGGGAAALCPHLPDPVVLLRHPELYAGHRKAHPRLHHLGFHRPGVPGGPHRPPVAPGPHRHLAQLPRHLRPGGYPFGGDPPAPAAGAFPAGRAFLWGVAALEDFRFAAARGFYVREKRFSVAPAGAPLSEHITWAGGKHFLLAQGFFPVILRSDRKSGLVLPCAMGSVLV